MCSGGEPGICSSAKGIYLGLAQRQRQWRQIPLSVRSNRTVETRKWSNWYDGWL